MERTCRICKRTKNITSFHRQKSGKDGYNNACKICMIHYLKQRNERINGVEDDNFKLTGVKKSDWCKTWELLKEMGYDINQNIHQQFIKKYGLKEKQRSKKPYLLYTPKDCLESLNITDLGSDQDLS